MALRKGMMGAYCSAPFWFSALCGALMPTSVGYQEVTALFLRQPDVAVRGREHRVASPLGAIETPTIKYSRPVGTALPEPAAYQKANFDPSAPEAVAMAIDPPLAANPAPQVKYPTVNRRLKGDRASPSNAVPGSEEPQNLPQLEPIDAPPAQPARQKPSRPRDARLPDRTPAATPANGDNPLQLSSLPSPQGIDTGVFGAEDDGSLSDMPSDITADGPADPLTAPPLASVAFIDDDPADHRSQIYFGAGTIGSPSGLERWAPGAEPMLVVRSSESGIKLAALAPDAGDLGAGGETIAGKDDPTRLESPADRLKLDSNAFAKAQKCLANAVYFEAGNQQLRGQEAVAQVIMNRVFSGFYPHDVCGVVYQNAHRHLRCQFTFACDGIPDRIHNQDWWEQAMRIGKETLEGKIWLADVGHATHYHAYYVHPGWARQMKKLVRLGAHLFYRPRAWGDGSDMPTWGLVPSATKPEDAADKPDAATKNPEAPKAPEAAASPAPAAAKNEPTEKL